MYQSPQQDPRKQPPNFNPNFHNDQTQQHYPLPPQFQQSSQFQQPPQFRQQQPSHARGFVPPHQQTPPRRKRNVWPWLLSLMVGVLAICGLCSYASYAMPPSTVANQNTPTATAAGPTQNVMLTTSTTVVPTQTAAPTATPTQAPTPTPKPTQPPVRPTQPPAPQQPPGPVYNFDPNGGQVVRDPPGDFCSTHTCVSTFWTATNGYVVMCGDGKYSHSGGVSGACSHNKGVKATLYQH